MPRKGKNPEEGLAALIVAYLQGLGWTVYQEIELRSGGSVADIVAVREGEVLVVETKMNFGLDVLAQAHHWKPKANYVAIAVPASLKRKTRARSFGYHVAFEEKMGLYEVDVEERRVIEKLVPIQLNGASGSFLKVLTEKHKTYAKAGNNEGKRLTRFKITTDQLIAYVRAHPNCPIKEAIAAIDHHYKTARGAEYSLGKQIVRFERIPPLEGTWDSKGKCLRLNIKGEEYPYPPRRKPLDSV